MNAEAKDTTDKVRQLQRALYLAAKASVERRFHALYDKVYREDILARAWAEVKANAGAAGVDERTLSDIEQSGVEEFLGELATELREGRYPEPPGSRDRPRAVRRVYIPKADGKQRPLGIPTVRDRVVQAAVKVVMEPIFEADFRNSSYGFRPKRSAHQAIEALRVAVNRGGNWVVDLDIEAFFDRIDPEVLMGLVEKRVNDRRLLKLLRQWLAAGVWEGGEVRFTDQGVPQGGVISPVLANIVLHELDREWEDEWSQLGQWIRYADDGVVVCRTEANAQAALRRIGEILDRLKLRLHPTKTRVVYVGDGKEGFDFLGFHCRKLESWRWRGKRYLQRWPSQRAMKRVRGRIKAITAPRHRSLDTGGSVLPEPVGAIVDELNPVLRGWGAYFRVGNAAVKFGQVDEYVRERLALFLSKKRHRSGRNWERHTLAFFQALGVYQLSGIVNWHKATPKTTR